VGISGQLREFLSLMACVAVREVKKNSNDAKILSRDDIPDYAILESIYLIIMATCILVLRRHKFSFNVKGILPFIILPS